MIKYKPISCSFYDILEASATLKRVEQIRYLDSEGWEWLEIQRIVDVFALDGCEYITLANEKQIRLDKLISVGDEKLSDYQKCKTSNYEKPNPTS